MAENTAPESTEAPKASKGKAPFLRGGSTKDITTVVTIYDNAKVDSRERADGSGMTKPGAFVNAEMARFEGANPNQKPQYNPAFRTEAVTNEAGETRHNTGVFYTDDEIESITTAAADNVQPIYRHVNGEPTDERIGVTMVVDVDAIIDKERGGLRMNHKTAKETKVEVPASIQDAQFEGRKADVQTLKAQAKETSKKVEAASEKSAEGAEAPAAQADEPEFG